MKCACMKPHVTDPGLFRIRGLHYDKLGSSVPMTSGQEGHQHHSIDFVFIFYKA